MTRERAIAGVAMAVCQGASIYLALTPDHSGRFGGDLELAKEAGAWFKSVEPLLKNAQPYGDIAMVLGTPDIEAPGVKPFRAVEHRTRLYTAKDELCRHGVFGEVLLDTARWGNWSASLDRYKAVIVPDLAPLDAAHANRLREYVRNGGCLIAFGRASLLDELARPHENYALADVFGADYRSGGPVPPPNATVKADSHLGANTPFNLINGCSSFWTSGASPMPHWVELTLKDAVDVARVELVNRDHAYQVCDADLEVSVDGAWKTVAAVRDWRDGTLKLEPEKPVRTSKLRVTIRREVAGRGKKPREYADLKAIRVFDTEGHDRSTSPEYVPVKPTTAKRFALASDRTDFPKILCNDFGRGRALLVTAAEESVSDNHDFGKMLAGVAVSKPTITYDPSVADRYRVVLTRVGDAHALHLIDRDVTKGGYRPAEVTLSVCSERLRGFEKVFPADSDTPLQCQRKDGNVMFTVRPDPVASVVLK